MPDLREFRHLFYFAHSFVGQECEKGLAGWVVLIHATPAGVGGLGDPSFYFSSLFKISNSCLPNIQGITLLPGLCSRTNEPHLTPRETIQITMRSLHSKPCPLPFIQPPGSLI